MHCVVIAAIAASVVHVLNLLFSLQLDALSPAVDILMSELGPETSKEGAVEALGKAVNVSTTKGRGAVKAVPMHFQDYTLQQGSTYSSTRIELKYTYLFPFSEIYCHLGNN